MFSALATTRSTLRSRTRAGRLAWTTCRPGRPTMSPKARIRTGMRRKSIPRVEIPRCAVEPHACVGSRRGHHILSMRTDPGDDAAPRDRQRFWLAVTIAFIVLGASLRLSQYGSRQSFWGDEAALLFNITQKSTAELMSGPLDHGQAAPPLFLATQRWIALTLGTGEYAQRLVPLLLGVAVPALGAWLAWQWTTPSGAAFVAAVLALSDAFIWQSATLKPYSGDVFFALVLLLIYPPPLPDDVARPRTRPVSQSRGRRFWIASIVAAVAVWYSLGVVFVYAGLASVALVDSYLHQRRNFQARFTAVALLFQGS